jgi:RND superfamily putative drug exporter
MAFGILLASLVVSSILVPAVTALAGQRARWPQGSTRRSAAKPRVKEVVPQATS